MFTSPLQFFKCLSEETRLKAILLIQQEGELCVCELVSALKLSQPKISRHLAQLRECGLLKDRRQGQWVYYKINPDLPNWALDVLSISGTENAKFIATEYKLLNAMNDRPQSSAQCC
jgi:ArsR family transcriptional regulator